MKYLRALRRHLASTLGLGAVLLAGLTGTAHAQAIYGVGAASGANYNRIYTVNPTSGAATDLGCTLQFNTAAMGVASLDGNIYYIEQTVANPRIASVNPQTCANGTAVATALPASVIRATACPDGRFYAMSNTAAFYEINPATGAILRTLNWTGLPTGGSGDFACTSDGSMYILAQDGTANYNLYRATSASFQTVANGSNVAASNLGDLGLAGSPNGLAEGPLGLAGCAASPNPCLLVSTGTTNQTWRVNVLTGVASNAGTTGAILTDLSRSFPVDISFSKAVTPTTVLQGQTVFYTLTASNPGPGVVREVAIQDTFPAGVASASWSCSVQSTGSSTIVTTSCGTTPTGTGNINNTVSLSLGASVRYNVTATLSSTFSGTLTNAGRATITSVATDPDPSNNTQTVSSSVTPAGNIGVTKSNAVGTLTAGQTTSYTITVSNSGPGNATNTVVTDPATTGLSCTTVTCSVASGTAVCPVAPALSIANLQGAGVTIATLPANSSLNFQVGCTVTATGTP